MAIKKDDKNLTKDMNFEDDKICSFCKKPKSEVSLLYNGNGCCICNDCVDQLYFMNLSILQQLTHNSIEDDETPKKHKKRKSNIVFDKSPKDIKQYLDQYVIGQDDAKKRLSTIVYNHYKRINQNIVDDVEIEKTNLVLVGPSGSGKTFLAKNIAKFLNVPMVVCDCTSITQAGYVGEDIESVITRLLQSCDYDIEKAEKGIICLDECDKLAKRGNNPSITRDVSGEGVQQGLLKMLEGSVVNVMPKGGRKHPEAPMIQVNTKNILFILCGAFVGIDNIIEKRKDSHKLGFESITAKKEIDKDNILKYINSEDLKNFGLIPELIGRAPIITYLNKLTKNDFKRILTEPKNAIIKQYKRLFEFDGIDLIIDDEVYEYITECAYKNDLGARSLRTIVENLLSDDMYELPKTDIKELHITLDYAKEKLKNYMNSYKE